jgi:hypothetical protein
VTVALAGFALLEMSMICFTGTTVVYPLVNPLHAVPVGSVNVKELAVTFPPAVPTVEL